MGQRCRARREGSRAATDERSHRHRVVGCLERRTRDESRARRDEAGDRVQGRGDQGGVRVQVGQNCGKARGEHCLARAWLAQQKHVVSSRSGDFHGCNALGLAADIRHVEDRDILRGTIPAAHAQVPLKRRFDCLSPSPCDHIREVFEGNDLDPRDQLRLARAGGGDDDAAHPERTSRQHGGQYPSHGLNAPVEGQFSDDDAVLEGPGQHQAGRQRNGRGDG